MQRNIDTNFVVRSCKLRAAADCRQKYSRAVIFEQSNFMIPAIS